MSEDAVFGATAVLKKRQKHLNNLNIQSVLDIVPVTTQKKMLRQK